MSMKKWLSDVRKDFLKKEFIPLKILYFFMMGGMTALFPFLSIQARSLGITGEELGIIYGIIPVIGIFTPTLAGLLADKVGNFKIILSLVVLASGFLSLLFLLIPPGRMVHTLPKQLPLTLNCTIDGAEITVAPPFVCDVNTKSNKNHTLEIQKCIYSCTNDVQQTQLVDEFLNQWCQRTENCHAWYDAEIVSDFESINDNSQNDSDFYGLDIEQTNRGEFSLNNKSLPLKIPEKGTNLEISRLFCPNLEELMESSKLLYPSSVEIDTKLQECWMTCEAVTETQTICNNTKSTEELNSTLTFIVYFIVRVANGITIAMSLTLFEGAVVAIVKQNKGDLGLQRVYANLGMIVLTPISGLLIDRVSKMNGKEDYSPAFGLYCGFRCLCALCMLFLNLKFKQPSNRVLKDFRELISQFRILCFVCFVIVAGACFGLLETFFFWLLEDLGADKSLMGTTITVGAACSIPVLLMSSVIIKKLGHVNTLVLCSFFFAVRLTGYSLINNPWMAMLFETLVCFTNALLMLTAIAYVGVLSRPSTVGSLQGIYMAAYAGIGRGTGCMAGGNLIKSIGIRATFQVFALSCGICGAIYFIINKFVFKNTTAVENSKEQSMMKEKEAASEQLFDVDQDNIEKCIRKSSKNEGELNWKEGEAKGNQTTKG